MTLAIHCCCGARVPRISALSLKQGVLAIIAIIGCQTAGSAGRPASPGSSDTRRDAAAGAEDTSRGVGVTECGADAGENDHNPAQPANAVPEFSGDYSGSDGLTYRDVPVSPEPAMDPDHPVAKISIKQRGNRLEVIWLASDTGDGLCTVTATVEGKRAEIRPGPRCFVSDGIQHRVEKGHVEFVCDRLVLQLELSVKVTGPDGPYSGRGDYLFKGKRIVG
jgi:hypothetical protein